MLVWFVEDQIKSIRDPERPDTLEDLEVLTEESVQVKRISDDLYHTVGELPNLPTLSQLTRDNRLAYLFCFSNICADSTSLQSRVSDRPLYQRKT